MLLPLPKSHISLPVFCKTHDQIWSRFRWQKYNRKANHILLGQLDLKIDFYDEKKVRNTRLGGLNRGNFEVHISFMSEN